MSAASSAPSSGVAMDDGTDGRRTVSYRNPRFGGCLQASIETRPDGSMVIESTEPLQPHPDCMTDLLTHWATVAPDRTFAARRDAAGRWQPVTYAAMLDRARRVGQGLLGRGLGPERPILILSGNDLEHLALSLGAMWIGVPYTPVSTAYSLVATDYAKLRHVVDTLTPGLVFASSIDYARAIAAVLPPDVTVVFGTLPEAMQSGRRGLDPVVPLPAGADAATPDALHDGAEAAVGANAGSSTKTGSGTDARVAEAVQLLAGRQVISFDDLLASKPGAALDAAHAAIGPDTIVKFLFTSGSTKEPKGVVNTHRMLCSNQQMLRQVLAFLGDEPPTLVDWLPWNHTFGGNHNVGITLYNGGTLYIDDGKPTPGGIGETLRNLREISPTIYFNVPKGFEEIASAMEDDATLRETLFGRVKAFMYAGAGLSQAVWDRLDHHAEQTVGERIPIITSLGMTETAPCCTFSVALDMQSGWIGLPVPGVRVKLVPDGDGDDAKMEIRFRGPNVMPCYWRAPQQSAEAFDDEGYYRTGDAVRFVDTADLSKGLIFDGRLAEDFKLSSGTFVNVGPLRARVLAAGAPLVADSVIAGPNRDDIALLIVPRLDSCRRLAGLPPDAAAPDVLAHPTVRDAFQAIIDRLWRDGTGSANRPARAHVLLDAPSLETGEMTDKGSLNQRAVLRHRAGLIDTMYDGSDPRLLLPGKR